MRQTRYPRLQASFDGPAVDGHGAPVVARLGRLRVRALRAASTQFGQAGRAIAMRIDPAGHRRRAGNRDGSIPSIKIVGELVSVK
jgi:hypothetical protein